MRFWDSSALVALIVEEARSVACRTLRRAHPSIAVWALSRTELTSAIHRLAREGQLDQGDVAVALKRLDRLS